MESIKTVALTKKYKDLTAVDSLSLTVQKGELISLLGVNGAGKSTTIKMLSCLTHPTSGDALIKGKSILSDPDYAKSVIAGSPQETAIACGLNVRENLELICGIYGLRGDERSQKITDISARLGLNQVLDRKAGKLSGGWQRRLSIAMALISEPDILFLDEPTLGLDVIARSELWDLIRSLKGRVTVLLTTQYMEEAESLSDRVAIMQNGRLILCDTPCRIVQNSGCDSFEKAFIKIVREGSK